MGPRQGGLARDNDPDRAVVTQLYQCERCDFKGTLDEVTQHEIWEHGIRPKTVMSVVAVVGMLYDSGGVVRARYSAQNGHDCGGGRGDDATKLHVTGLSSHKQLLSTECSHNSLLGAMDVTT